jgi:hypothetical protein
MLLQQPWVLLLLRSLLQVGVHSELLRVHSELLLQQSLATIL